jgi:sulfite exporter TauE/SafE
LDNLLEVLRMVMGILLKMMALIIMEKWEIIKQTMKTENIGHLVSNTMVELLITKFKGKDVKLDHSILSKVLTLKAKKSMEY